jgi:riboflavin synthase
MFTGIVECIGVVKNVERHADLITVLIDLPTLYEDIKQGDSILVDGVCLTVKKHFGQNLKTSFLSDIMNVTAQKTTLKYIRMGKKVNIERAMRFDGRFGGHFVAGHIDSIGRIQVISKQAGETVFEVFPEENIIGFIAPQGSIAVNGISLTVVKVRTKSFTFHCIPHTLSFTTIDNISSGEAVNIEVDIIARYICRLIRTRRSENAIREFFNE